MKQKKRANKLENICWDMLNLLEEVTLDRGAWSGSDWNFFAEQVRGTKERLEDVIKEYG